MLRRYTERIGSFFWGLYGCLFFSIFFCVLFFNKIFNYQPLLQLILLAAWGSLFWSALVLIRRFTPWLTAHLNLVLAAVLVFIFAVQFTISLFTVPNPMYDHGKVFYGAVAFAEGADTEQFATYSEYLHHYTNNVGLFLVLQLLFSCMRAVGITNYYLAACLVGHLLFSLMLAACFFYLKGLAGERPALLFLPLAALFPPLYFQSTISYTDTYSIWAAPCALLCAQRAGRAGTLPKKLLLGALAGFCFGLGAQLKATVLICAVALFIQLLLTVRLRRSLAVLAAGLALFCCVRYGFDLWAHRLVLDRDRAGEAMPVTHWLMMGLQGDGSYNWMDEWRITGTVSGTQARVEKNLQVIRQRLEEMGPLGYCRLLYTKTCRSFGSGTADMSYNYQYMNQSIPVNWLYELVLENGRCYFLYNNLAHSSYLALCLLGTMGALLVLLRRSSLRGSFVLPLSLTGFWLFMMLWESNHRQLINQWPFYLMLAALGLFLLSAPGSAKKQKSPQTA